MKKIDFQYSSYGIFYEHYSLNSIISLLSITLCSAMLFVCGTMYLGFPVDCHLILTYAGITFCLFTLNYYSYNGGSFESNQIKLSINDNPSLFIISMIVFIQSIFILVSHNKLTLYHFVLIYTGFSYSVKIIPWPSFSKNKIIFIRLKDVAFVNNIIVSILLGLSLIFINHAVYSVTLYLDYHILILILSGAIVTFVNSNFAHIKNMNIDKINGMPTIPVIFGIKNTYRYAMVIPGIVWLSICIILTFSGIISGTFFTILMANLLFPFFYITFCYKKKISTFSVEIVSNASIILFSSGLLILRYQY